MSSTPQFSEGVRLVIWDLDELFWHGTLTEGGMVWNADNAQAVQTLARRGILSSICSRNDFDAAMAPIRAHGLEEFFVFPSIDWRPKGARVRAIVEQSQLRPQTVLFLDDLALNRSEVAACNPGLVVADDTFARQLLSHPALAGRPDPDLTRLRHYRALEQRQHDVQQSPADPDAFLRQSDIRVSLHHNLEDHVERCVELINRTNQLNFTKLRLSDDGPNARDEFLQLISRPRIQGALVHCQDRYGDHDFVGLYVIEEGKTLRHFLFSCRVLGLGIEQWLYRRLGRPWLQVQGEVLSDPTDSTRVIDWITLVEPGARGGGGGQDAPALLQTPIEQFVVLGGCVMENIGHYLQVVSSNVVHEGNARRDGFDIRRTHTLFLTQGHLLRFPLYQQAIERIGYTVADFDNRIFAVNGRSALLLSFWYDQICPIYQHRRLALQLPFLIDGVRWDRDVTTLTFDELPQEFQQAPNARRWFEAFLQDFVFRDLIEATGYHQRVATILSRLPAETPVFLLDLPSPSGPGFELCIQPDRIVPIQEVHRQLVKARANTWLIDPMEFILEPSDRHDWWHFDRRVYFRIHSRILELLPCRDQAA